MLSQCTYEWDEELVLEELDAFLGVWGSATPDLQAVEVWICRAYDRWENAKVAGLQMMFEEAGLLCTVPYTSEHSYSTMGFQWVRQPSNP